MINPESAAASHFLSIHVMVEAKRLGEGKPLKARLREAPSLMLSSGLAGLLSFYASKSDRRLLEILHDYFKNAINHRSRDDAEKAVEGLLQRLRQERGEKLAEALKDELSAEGGGYTIALALITSYLDAQGLLAPGGEGVLPRLAATVKTLVESLPHSAEAEALLAPYLLELKRLVDALVREEQP